MSWSVRAAPSRGMWSEHHGPGADAGDDPQEVAPGEPERVAVPRLVEGRGVDAVGAELVAGSGGAGRPRRPAGLDVEDGAEVVGDVDRPVAALGDLPVEPAGPPLGVEVGVAGVGVAVQHAGRREPRRSGASPPGASAASRRCAGRSGPRPSSRRPWSALGREERRHLVDAGGEPVDVPLLVAPGARRGAARAGPACPGRSRREYGSCASRNRPPRATTSSITMRPTVRGLVDARVVGPRRRGPRGAAGGRGRSAPRRAAS